MTNKPVVVELVRGQGKKCGALLFSLNFLWLLSLFQDKESDKERETKASLTFHHQLHRNPNRFTNSGKYSRPDIRHKVLMVITTNTNRRLS